MEPYVLARASHCNPISDCPCCVIHLWVRVGVHCHANTDVLAGGLGRFLLPFPSNPCPRLLGICSVCLTPIVNPFVSCDKLTAGIADNSQRLIPPQFLNSDAFNEGVAQDSA